MVLALGIPYSFSGSYSFSIALFVVKTSRNSLATSWPRSLADPLPPLLAVDDNASSADCRPATPASVSSASVSAAAASTSSSFPARVEFEVEDDEEEDEEDEDEEL